MLRAFIVAMLLLVLSPANAAEITCAREFDVQNYKLTIGDYREMWPSGFMISASGDCDEAFFHGPVQRGDFERVRAFVGKHQRTLHTVHLMSPGGVVGEALEIGKLFRKYLLTAQAPEDADGIPYLAFRAPNKAADALDHMMGGKQLTLCKGSHCVCASACALIWFGAPLRSGTVGVHRPFFNDPEYKRLPPDRAAAYYKTLLAAMEVYSLDMDVPRQIMDQMVSTASADLSLVNSDKQIDLRRALTFGEWVDASCGRIPLSERELHSTLRFRRDFGGQQLSLSPGERYALDGLDAKIEAHKKCQFKIRMRAVDALPAP